MIERRVGSENYAEVAVVAANTVTWTDPGPFTDGSSVSYRVRARIVAPGGGTIIDTATTSALGSIGSGVTGWVTSIAAPANLVASASQTSRIDLAWDAVSGATGYAVEVSHDRGRTFKSLDSTDNATTTCSDIGTVAGMEYYYRVRSTNADGTGLPCSAVSITATFDLSIAPPTGFTAEEVGDDILLLWQDHATNETAYAIEQRSGAATWTRIATVAANSTSHTIIDGSPWTLYRVQALGNGGGSRYSQPAKGTDTSSDPAPESLTVSGRTSSSISLSWTSGGGSASECLQRSDNDGPFRTIAYPSNASFTDWGLPAGTTYRYRVAHEFDRSTTSAIIEASTKASTGTPNAPDGLTAGGVARGQINLRWNDRSDNETGFVVQRAPGGGSFATVATLAAGADGWCDTGLDAASTHDYRVKATGTAGESGWSATASATTNNSDPTIGIETIQAATFRALHITGTSANDTIAVAADGDDLLVTANGTTSTRSGPYDVLVIRGGAGADHISLAASVDQRAYCYGDEHDDVLSSDGSGRCFLITLGGGIDHLDGNGVDSSYWCDPRDTVVASSRERHWHRVHCIERFEQFWTTNPSKSTFITTEPDGRRWDDDTSETAVYPAAPFWGDSPVLFDVNQGWLQNCPLTGYYQCVADRHPERLAEAGIPLGDGTYAVQCGDSDGAVYARVDGDVNPGWMGTLGPSGQQWFLILEKVYSGYGMRNYEPTQTTAATLPDGQRLYFEGDPDALYDLIRSALDRDEIVTCGTTGTPLDAPLVRQGHNHGILEAYRDASGEPYVIIRNPYGINTTAWDTAPLHRTQGLMRMSIAHLRANFTSGVNRNWAPITRVITFQVLEDSAALPVDAVLEPGPMRVVPDANETHVFPGLDPASRHRVRVEAVLGGSG